MSDNRKWNIMKKSVIKQQQKTLLIKLFKNRERILFKLIRHFLLTLVKMNPKYRSRIYLLFSFLCCCFPETHKH